MVEPEEPTASEAGGLVLKSAALLAAASFVLSAIGIFWVCSEPEDSWIALGPMLFVSIAVLLAGRIIIYNLLGVYVSCMPRLYQRIIARFLLALCMIFVVWSHAVVLTPITAPDFDDVVCDGYEYFDPTLPIGR
ncbi:MAG: hypothetical protein ABJQ80_00960 [Lentilitoribacter sp.]